MIQIILVRKKRISRNRPGINAAGKSVFYHYSFYQVAVSPVDQFPYPKVPSLSEKIDFKFFFGCTVNVMAIGAENCNHKDRIISDQ